MSQIKRILSAFVLAVLVVTGVNVQVGTGVANADCQGDWAAYWRQNSPGTPVPPMPPQWCQTQQPTQPTQTPLPTAAPTNTAIPSPVSPTPEPTTAPPSPTTAPQQSGNGAGAAPTAANPPETTQPFRLPGDTTAPPTTQPPTTGQPTQPSTRVSVPQSVPATTSAKAKREMTDAQKKKREAAGCEENPWFDRIDPDQIKPTDPDYADWKKFEKEARRQPNINKMRESGTGNAVDHILALRALWELPGFKRLPLASQLAIADDPMNLRLLLGRINSSKGQHPASQYGQTWFPGADIEDLMSVEELRAMCEAEKEATPVLMFQISQKLAEMPSTAQEGAGEGSGSGASDSASGSDSGSASEDSGSTSTPTLTSVPTPTEVPYTPPQTATEPPGTPENPTGTPAQPPATENPPAAPAKPTTQTEKPADVPAPTTQAAPEPAKSSGNIFTRNWKKIAVGVGVGALVVGGVACVMATAGICAGVGAGTAATVGTRAMYALAA